MKEPSTFGSAIIMKPPRGQMWSAFGSSAKPPVAAPRDRQLLVTVVEEVLRVVEPVASAARAAPRRRRRRPRRPRPAMRSVCRRRRLDGELAAGRRRGRRSAAETTAARVRLARPPRPAAGSAPARETEWMDWCRPCRTAGTPARRRGACTIRPRIGIASSRRRARGRRARAPAGPRREIARLIDGRRGPLPPRVRAPLEELDRGARAGRGRRPASEPPSPAPTIAPCDHFTLDMRSGAPRRSARRRGSVL